MNDNNEQDLATADQVVIVVQQRREHLTFPDLGMMWLLDLGDAVVANSVGRC